MWIRSANSSRSSGGGNRYFFWRINGSGADARLSKEDEVIWCRPVERARRMAMPCKTHPYCQSTHLRRTVPCIRSQSKGISLPDIGAEHTSNTHLVKSTAAIHIRTQQEPRPHLVQHPVRQCRLLPHGRATLLKVLFFQLHVILARETRGPEILQVSDAPCFKNQCEGDDWSCELVILVEQGGTYDSTQKRP